MLKHFTYRVYIARTDNEKEKYSLHTKMRSYADHLYAM